MSKRLPIVGWAAGRDRQGNQTQVFHLLVEHRLVGSRTWAKAACSPTITTCGEVFPELPAGAHPCATCARSRHLLLPPSFPSKGVQ